jgi:hypothetical protein
VRDFTLASRTSAELQQLQNAFISTLISSIATNSGQQWDAVLHKYAINSLAYHVRSAVSAPFTAGGLAASLLLHEDPSIVAATIDGIDRSDVVEHAKQFLLDDTEAGFWAASRLYYALAVIASGVGVDERCEAINAALQNVKHVRPEFQSGATFLQMDCLTKLIWFARTEEEVDDCADKLIALAKRGSCHPDENAMVQGKKNWVGIILIGQLPTQRSMNITLTQAKEAALYLVEAYGCRYTRKLVDALPEDSYEKYSALENSLYPTTTYSIALLQWLKFKEYMTSALLGDPSIAAREVVEAYDVTKYHARAMSKYGFDMVVTKNRPNYIKEKSV